MLFDWNNYLALAEELHKTSCILTDNESVQRTSISRSYYAAYHHAYAYVEMKGCEELKGNGTDHKIVQDWVDIDEPELASVLGRLRKYRRNADYYEEFNEGLEDPAKMAEKAIIYAKQIINQLHLSSTLFPHSYTIKVVLPLSLHPL
jgi:uncharacterized protein (UPF0332 family)